MGVSNDGLRLCDVIKQQYSIATWVWMGGVGPFTLYCVVVRMQGLKNVARKSVTLSTHETKDVKVVSYVEKYTD